MWYILQLLKKLFSERYIEYPKTWRKILNLRHSSLQSKAILFSFIFIIIFTGGFLYNYYFAKSKNEQSFSKNKVTKQYFSKVTILTLFLILNFFMNEIHIFAYNVQDTYWHTPSNPNFWIFLFTVTVLLFGFLTLNSNLVPENFHLHYKFYDGDVISSILLGVNVLYAFLNILKDTASVSYLILLVFSITSLILNSKIVNNWIIYAISTLFMVNNMQYVTNMDVGIGWFIFHYFIYALQLSLFMFGLIKLEDFKFFESFQNIFSKSNK